MNEYLISKAVLIKVKEAMDLIDGDRGEWENTKEENIQTGRVYPLLAVTEELIKDLFIEQDTQEGEKK